MEKSILSKLLSTHFSFLFQHSFSMVDSMDYLEYYSCFSNGVVDISITYDIRTHDLYLSLTPTRSATRWLDARDILDTSIGSLEERLILKRNIADAHDFVKQYRRAIPPEYVERFIVSYAAFVKKHLQEILLWEPAPIHKE
jgi:hypothetical protein